mmetsp:Transcript_7120/g.13543  ORF Transcript_7120/g.13543 Transcript_7120/m.13543 type:complete len:350 (+) Transcript_7120:335-1384(+)
MDQSSKEGGKTRSGTKKQSFRTKAQITVGLDSTPTHSLLCPSQVPARAFRNLDCRNRRTGNTRPHTSTSTTTTTMYSICTICITKPICLQLQLHTPIGMELTVTLGLGKPPSQSMSPRCQCQISAGNTPFPATHARQVSHLPAAVRPSNINTYQQICVRTSTRLGPMLCLFCLRRRTRRTRTNLSPGGPNRYCQTAATTSVPCALRGSSARKPLPATLRGGSTCASLALCVGRSPHWSARLVRRFERGWVSTSEPSSAALTTRCKSGSSIMKRCTPSTHFQEFPVSASKSRWRCGTWSGQRAQSRTNYRKQNPRIRPLVLSRNPRVEIAASQDVKRRVVTVLQTPLGAM